MEADINAVIRFAQGLVIACTVLKIAQILSTSRSDENTVKEALKKCGKVLKAAAIALVMTEIVDVIKVVLGEAGEGWTSIMVKLNKLAQMGTNALIAMEGVLVTFLCVKDGMMYQKAEPEEKKGYKKNIKNNLMIGILMLSITTVVRIVLGYFQ